MFLILILVVIILMFLLYMFAYDFNYWKRKGVPYIKPLPLVGNALPIFRLRSSLGQLYQTLYQQMTAPYFGIYILNKPCMVIRSPELIKSILTKDFEHFSDRTIYCDVKYDSISSYMVGLIKNPEWRSLREKLTPIFTSAKLKKMWGLVDESTKDLNCYVNRNIDEDFIEACDLCAKYTVDIISSCTFGIQANSFQSENGEFSQACKRFIGFNWKIAFSQACYFLMPGLVKLFKLKFMDPQTMSFLSDIFWETVQKRQDSKLIRNDLIDIIIQMRNDDVNFVGDKVVAQPIQFLIAGHDTSAMTMAFVLYELCLHPEIQKKLRMEIKTYLSQNGDFSYDTINDMKYLHMVICETLRKYPPVSFLDRECVGQYRIPGSDTIIEKNTALFISLHGLHYDPQYFPDPQKFDPERFSPENKESILKYTYLPFGEGPRSCLGERFAWLSVKLALASVLVEYEVEVCSKTPIPIEIDPKAFLLAPLGGIPIKFKKGSDY